MTGAALRRRLLAQPRLRNRFRDPSIVPLGARPVLDAVIELVAGSGPELEYHPDPEIDGRRSLVQIVAFQAEAIGCEAEIEGHLHTLIRAELVVLTDQVGFRLGLPERTAASATKAKSNRANSRFSTGPRPQGMGEAEWAERKAAKRAQVEAELRRQTSFALPIPGGLDGHAESQIRSQDRSHLALVDEAKTGGPVASAGADLASRALGSAAAAFVPSVEIQAAAAASSLRATGAPGSGLASGEANPDYRLAFALALAAVDAVANPPRPVNAAVASDLASGADLALPRALASGSSLASTSGLASPEAKSALASVASPSDLASPGRLASPEAKPGRSAQVASAPDLASPASLASPEAKSRGQAGAGEGALARVLAQEAAAVFRWSPQMTAEAPKIMQQYLDEGFTGAEVRAVVAAKQGAVCNGAGYLRMPLLERYPRTAAASLHVPAGVDAPPVVRPDVAADPEWSALPPAKQARLSRLLDVIAMPPGAERNRRAKAMRELSGDLFALVARRRPGIYAEFGLQEGEAGAEPRSAAG